MGEWERRGTKHDETRAIEAARWDGDAAAQTDVMGVKTEAKAVVCAHTQPPFSAAIRPAKVAPRTPSPSKTPLILFS
jgi:hypothetical protein